MTARTSADCRVITRIAHHAARDFTPQLARRYANPVV